MSPAAVLTLLLLTITPLMGQGGVSDRAPMSGLLAEVVFASSVVPRRVRQFRDEILRLGARDPGRPGNAACAAWIAERFEKDGLRVTRERLAERRREAVTAFTCNLAIPGSSRTEPLEGAVVLHAGSLPRRRLPLRAAARRDAEAGPAHAVWIERPVTAGRLVLRAEDLEQWKRQGARAVVVGWTAEGSAEQPGGTPLAVSIAEDGRAALPVFALAPKATKRLQAKPGVPDAHRLELGLDVKSEKAVVNDVWGVVDGVKAEKPLIVVSTHIAPEGVGPDATGAGSLAVLVEMAHDLGLSRRTTEFTPLAPGVVFLALGDRAQGLAAWLARHPELAKRVTLHLQLERLGAFARPATLFLDTLAPDRRARPFVRGLTALEFYRQRKGFWATVEVLKEGGDEAWPPHPWRRRPLTEAPGLVLSTDPMDPSWMRDTTIEPAAPSATGSSEAIPSSRRLLTSGDVPVEGDHEALVSAARAGLVLLRRLGTEEVQ